MDDKQRIKQLEEALAESNASNTEKDKEIAQAKQDAIDARNNVASPCGFLDIWDEDSANFRREYTYEWLIETAKQAKDNDGIMGIRYQMQKATNQTKGTTMSLQVYLSHCVPYAEDNAKKKKLGIEYQNEQFSKNVGGRNYWKNAPKEKPTVASVN